MRKIATALILAIFALGFTSACGGGPPNLSGMIGGDNPLCQVGQKMSVLTVQHIDNDSEMYYEVEVITPGNQIVWMQFWENMYELQGVYPTKKSAYIERITNATGINAEYRYTLYMPTNQRVEGGRVSYTFGKGQDGTTTTTTVLPPK